MRAFYYSLVLSATLVAALVVLWGDPLYSRLLELTNATVLVEERAVTRVPPDDLKRAGALGMVSVLDDYSTWHDRRADTLIRREASGHYGGFGIEIVNYDDTTLIWQVFPESPAHSAGLKMGDRLLSADSISLLGVSLDSVHLILQTLPSALVDLTVYRPGESRLLHIQSGRGRIDVGTVRVWDLQDGVGYITLESFNARTADALDRALDTLVRAGATKFILDLRGNPGGLLQSAVECAELFMAQHGTVVKITDHGPTEVIDAEVGPFPSQPLVILVDSYSASGSELFSGCLQDWDRAVLIGRPTFGKGFIQNLFPLLDESSLRLTIGRYRTPSGRTFYRPDSTAVPDTTHYTSLLNKRPVLGGGQIFPDIETSELGCPPYLEGWIQSRGAFEFAVSLLARPVLPPLDSNLLKEFWHSRYDDYHDGMATQFAETLPASLMHDAQLAKSLSVARDVEAEFDRHAAADCLLYVLSRHLARGEAQISLLEPSLLRLDPTLSEAMNVLQTPGRYESLLSGPRESAESPPEASR